ncbi:hypothetical protein CFC21_065442 [Triticum aestivum]|uniref:Fasciclin-like protein FLA28 n=3 Tax=Triticum TaxID=4564 RepID=A0A9R1H4T6_WHEAT|nr:fasciclin-like arabinogalactan protein 2 [Triticum aestivum]ABI95418.1 fasciclin-like protein FLA28 [Triticum aestivum]KAF7058367.1 hypothetical protein CFC21_065442 [Triticum aestivum]VAI16843.1 unnamed protein product [Triticum turgidum subsp. durum]
MARSRQSILLAFAVGAMAAVLLASPAAAKSYNITKILAAHPEFSKFNAMLSKTRLASDINRRQTITVLALDNSAMAALDHYTLPTVRHILSLHVLVDYYGNKKLKQLSRGATASASMFQSTGTASGMSGYVNITSHKGGKVEFVSQDADDTVKPSRYVKSIKEIPYDISVLEIASVLSSSEAEAPVPPPAPVDLIELLSKKHCKSFAGLISGNADVFRTLNDTKDNGLTLFCPVDAAVAAFMPKYKNLTTKAKTAILLYHGVPDYFSLQLLKSNNGMVSTLATTSEVKKDYSYDVQNDDEKVTLVTKVVTSTVTATVGDSEPLAVYAVSKFLKPKELFKVAQAPTPAPSKKGKKEAGDDDDSSDDEDSDDATTDKGDAAPAVYGRWATAAATAGAVLALLMA